MSSLWLDQAEQKAFGVRLECRRRLGGAGLHRHANFVRTVRDRQTALALTFKPARCPAWLPEMPGACDAGPALEEPLALLLAGVGGTPALLCF